MQDVITTLSMSTKTLERRLADRDTSFSTLLDDVRSDSRSTIWHVTDLRLEQIAYLTGYSEPAALVRAFNVGQVATLPMQFRPIHRGD